MVKNVKWARRLALKDALRRIRNEIGYNHGSVTLPQNDWVQDRLSERGFFIDLAAVKNPTLLTPRTDQMEVSW